MLFLWVKWLHIVSVICWMAGILYLYRLLVYHAEKGLTSKDNHELLSLMEKRLYRYITLPAMILTWAAGIWMITLQPAMWTMGKWLHIKFGLVILLTGATHAAGAFIKKFQTLPESAPSSKKLRFLNEIPTLLMLVIVWLVIFKPF
ncbi:MAG: CopD family protein [Zetaproteobacteria bacterium]|nr:CopD family protein [Zetaproteobacteria bacterium]